MYVEIALYKPTVYSLLHCFLLSNLRRRRDVMFASNCLSVRHWDYSKTQEHILVTRPAARGNELSTVFGIIARFFHCQHDNSWTAALSLMKFCTNMYLYNLWNRVEFQGHRSRSRGFFVRFCLHDTRGQYLALSEGFACIWRCTAEPICVQRSVLIKPAKSWTSRQPLFDRMLVDKLNANVLKTSCLRLRKHL